MVGQSALTANTPYDLPFAIEIFPTGMEHYYDSTADNHRVFKG